MKWLLLSLFIIFTGCSRTKVLPPCNLETNNCPEKYLCTISLNGGSCQSTAVGNSSFKARLPFDSIQPIKCLSGLNQAKRIYQKDVDTFALFLTGMSELKALDVKAVADGIVHVYDECPNKQSSSKTAAATTCGLGLGNHIRILHPKGYLSVYAHLSEIKVQTGDKVRAGDTIAIEGTSGGTKRRGVRLSIHRPWASKLLLSQPGQTGRSFPFLLEFREANDKKAHWRASTDLKCGQNIGTPFIYAAKTHKGKHENK